MASETEKIYISYNQVHNICREVSGTIRKDIQPDLIVAIGGGGFPPARILRTFLKGARKDGKNIPIQAIGLSLYEDLGTTGPEETMGSEVRRTQWLDFSSLEAKSLIGKRILIVDEVDDTRTTLHYAVRELEKDVREYSERMGLSGAKTEFSIFVLLNKDKPKNAELPENMIKEGRYIAGRTVADLWSVFPWEAEDIEAHDKLVNLQNY